MQVKATQQSAQSFQVCEILTNKFTAEAFCLLVTSQTSDFHNCVFLKRPLWKAERQISQAVSSRFAFQFPGLVVCHCLRRRKVPTERPQKTRGKQSLQCWDEKMGNFGSAQQVDVGRNECFCNRGSLPSPFRGKQSQFLLHDKPQRLTSTQTGADGWTETRGTECEWNKERSSLRTDG